MNKEPLENILYAFLKTGNHFELPVISYRNPTSKDSSCFIGKRANYAFPIDFKSLKKGFIVSPFDNLDNTRNIFIEQLIEFNDGKVSELNPNAQTGEIVDYLHQLQIKKAEPKGKYFFTKDLPSTTAEEISLFHKRVEHAKKTLENPNDHKVVLAARKKISFSHKVRPEKLYLQVCKQFPNSFISLISIPNVGTWIGASPEILLNYNSGEIYTEAIAGTKTQHQLDDEGWTKKEIKEQKIVSEKIVDCFKRSDIHDSIEGKTSTISAGGIFHLKTPICAKVDTNALQKCTQLMNEIHPTAATCGYPKLDSFNYLKSFEPFSRDFYTGYLGPVHSNQKLELYANIRCFQTFENDIVLYVGAGITDDSDPVSEQEEINTKFKSIENALTPFMELVSQTTAPDNTDNV